MTKRILSLGLAAALSTVASIAPAATGKRFEWTTKSAEAKQGLLEVQQRIESFQFGSDTVAAAQKVVAADPEFAMGVYYLSAVTPPPENEKHLEKAVALAKKASDGERRFIDAMVVARANQGANFKDAIPALEKLAADYPGERLVQVILGQIYQGVDAEKARAAFGRADEIGPPSPRVRAFLASEDLVEGQYDKARRTFLDVEKTLPKGAAPFAVRYGLAFSYLYQGQVDPALSALQTYLAEYRDSGAAQGFPEVFIWNSIARINLENGRLDAAMKAYEKGYESVPGSSLPGGPEAGVAGPPEARAVPRPREDGEARGGLGPGPRGQEDDRRRRRGRQAVPARLALPRRLPQAGGRRLRLGRRGAEAGQPGGPLPQAAARAGLREEGRSGGRPGGLQGGRGFPPEQHRARARLPGGEEEARELTPRRRWSRRASSRDGILVTFRRCATPSSSAPTTPAST